MKTLIGLALLTTPLLADSSALIPDTPNPVPSPDQPMIEVSTDPSSTIDTPAVQTSTSPAPEEGCEIYCDDYGSSVLNEFKMGYFRFADKKLRQRYNDGLLDLQLTSSINFWKRLYAYVGVEYVESDGRIPKSHTKIKIRMLPVSLGVQYMKPITYDLNYYFTIGGRYFFVHQWTHSRSLTHRGLGGFANTGFIYYLNYHLVFDIFGEYSIKKMHFHDMGGSERVGGLTLGAGIGYFW